MDFFQVFLVVNVVTQLMYEITEVVRILCKVEVTWGFLFLANGHDGEL